MLSYLLVLSLAVDSEISENVLLIDAVIETATHVEGIPRIIEEGLV